MQRPLYLIRRIPEDSLFSLKKSCMKLSKGQWPFKIMMLLPLFYQASLCIISIWFCIMNLECIFIIFIRYSQLMPVLMPILWRLQNPDPQSGTCICVYIQILLLCWCIIYAYDPINMLIPSELYVYVRYVGKSGITLAIIRTLNRLIYFLYLLLEIMIK